MMKIQSDLHGTRTCRSRDKELYDNINTQFLCVMNGGILVQHCNNHAIGWTHQITDGNVIYEITSTHHQMQYPFKLDKKDYDLLYVTPDPRSSTYIGDSISKAVIRRYGEPEIVLYHKDGLPKCLAVQGHPEMIPDSPVSKMISKLVKDLVNGNR